MAKTIKALYQDGVFKPLTKVQLKNRQRVELTVIEKEADRDREGEAVQTVCKICCRPSSW